MAEKKQRQPAVPIAEQPRPLAPAAPPPPPSEGTKLTRYRVTIRHSPLHQSCKSLVVEAASEAAAKDAWLRHVEQALSHTEAHRKNLDEFRSWVRTPAGAEGMAALDIRPEAVFEAARRGAQATVEEGIKGAQARAALEKVAAATR